MKANKFFKWALSAMAGLALGLSVISAGAAGVAGGIVIGAELGVYGGAVTGGAASVSSGNAVAATQINGVGTSFQHTDGVSAGTATIGGSVNSLGAQVVTSTSQIAQVNSYGTISGNAPVEVGGSIYNGTGGLAKSDNLASGTAQFATAGIGGYAGIGGAVGYGGF